MNELTDEQIEAVFSALPGIYFTEQSENVYMARAVIAADRAQRQAGQEPAAFDAQAEQIKRMQEVIDCLVEQKAAYAEAWSAMLAAPPAAPVPETCHWSSDEDGTYHTGCGNLFQFTDGGPKDNEAKFCCYCGGALDADPA